VTYPRGNLAKPTLGPDQAALPKTAEVWRHRKILTGNFQKSYPDPGGFPTAQLETGCETGNAWSASLGFVTDGDHASRVRPSVAVAAREPTWTGSGSLSGGRLFYATN